MILSIQGDMMYVDFAVCGRIPKNPYNPTFVHIILNYFEDMKRWKSHNTEF